MRLLGTCEVLVELMMARAGERSAFGRSLIDYDALRQLLQVDVPVLASDTQASVKALLPAFAATANPVDVTAGGRLSAFSGMFGGALDLVLGDAGIGIRRFQQECLGTGLNVDAIEIVLLRLLLESRYKRLSIR